MNLRAHNTIDKAYEEATEAAEGQGLCIEEKFDGHRYQVICLQPTTAAFVHLRRKQHKGGTRQPLGSRPHAPEPRRTPCEGRVPSEPPGGVLDMHMPGYLAGHCYKLAPGVGAQVGG